MTETEKLAKNDLRRALLACLHTGIVAFSLALIVTNNATWISSFNVALNSVFAALWVTRIGRR